MASYSYGTSCPPSLPSPTPFHTMDSLEFATGKPSPRRELQLHGPRPTPLKVSKDSYKIKKLPAAPPQAQQPVPPQPPQQQQQQHRPPVIIYTVSPKVIHTKPSEFMTLVQRLTGPSSSSSVSPTASVSPTGGELSPAARLATYEKAQRSDAAKPGTGGLETLDQIDAGGATFEKSSCYPGILSPVPASLPLISPNFFSSPVDPNNSLGFLHNMSPMSQDNKNYVDNTFLTSPNNFLSTPTLSSPAAYWDLFNQGF